jgi:GT2 family glycosyltransferase
VIFYFAILTHNRPDGLLALAQSIARLQLPPSSRCRLVVLDNGSDPEHSERLSRAPLLAELGASYVRSPVNTFMAGKWHLEELVLREWGGEPEAFLVHLDDDVQLEESWLVQAWSALEERGWDASGSVECWQGELVFSGQPRLWLSQEEVDGRTVGVWDWRWETVPDTPRRSVVAFAGHRALLVRMEAASRVRHDPSLLIGGEDLDYSLALRRAAFTIGIAHDARIQHRGLGEQDAPGFRTYDKVLASWRRFYRKWGFVRRNANREANLPPQEWLRRVSAP